MRSVAQASSLWMGKAIVGGVQPHSRTIFHASGGKAVSISGML